MLVCRVERVEEVLLKILGKCFSCLLQKAGQYRDPVVCLFVCLFLGPSVFGSTLVFKSVSASSLINAFYH